MKIRIAFFFLGVFIVCLAEPVNAQSVSYCNRYSDVRPNSWSESPREKCQCAINSSYCVSSVDREKAFNSTSSPETVCRRQNKIPVPGLGCQKCSKFAGLATSNAAIVIKTITNYNLPTGGGKAVIDKIGSGVA